MKRNKIFIDTWGWVALGDARDNHHAELVEIYESAKINGIRIITSDYILQELITLLFRRAPAMQSCRFIEGLLKAEGKGLLSIERIERERFKNAWELRKRLTDKPMISFVDLTTVIVMKELKIKDIVTMDKHFLHIGCGFEIQPAASHSL